MIDQDEPKDDLQAIGSARIVDLNLVRFWTQS